MFVIGSIAVAARKVFGKHAMKIIGGIIALTVIGYLAHVIF